jgi:hypothetical protein
MVDSKLMTREQAVIEQRKIAQQIKNDIEQGCIAEYERQRRQHQTSLTCEHRDEQEYIEIGEFDFNVCPRCQDMIVQVLSIHGDIRRRGVATR